MSIFRCVFILAMLAITQIILMMHGLKRKGANKHESMLFITTIRVIFLLLLLFVMAKQIFENLLITHYIHK